MLEPAVQDLRVRTSVVAVALALAGQLALVAQVPTPEPVSPPRAKELVALLQAKKLDAFAVKDPTTPGRFVAVLLVPGAQLLVISAAYEHPTDEEGRIYTKDFMNAYVELNSSILSKDKVFIEDALCDGLKPMPSGGVADSITIGTAKHVFDGDFVDPKKHAQNSKKPTQDEYMKAFSDADAKYAQFLTMLIDELKKMQADLGAAGQLR